MNFNKPSCASRAAPSLPERTLAAWSAICKSAAHFGSILKSTGSGALRSTQASFDRHVWWLGPLLVAGVMLLVAQLVMEAIFLPQVFKSYRTYECVQVLMLDGSPGSCENLPDAYEVVWVP